MYLFLIYQYKRGIDFKSTFVLSMYCLNINADFKLAALLNGFNLEMVEKCGQRKIVWLFNKASTIGF